MMVISMYQKIAKIIKIFNAKCADDGKKQM